MTEDAATARRSSDPDLTWKRRLLEISPEGKEILRLLERGYPQECTAKELAPRISLPKSTVNRKLYRELDPWVISRGNRPPAWSLRPARDADTDAEARTDGLRDPDHPTFQRLKEKRREVAERRGVPPFEVFHDRTLWEMVEVGPETKTELTPLWGVGKWKANLYGDDFLEALHLEGDGSP